jgi:hypothetical protein
MMVEHDKILSNVTQMIIKWHIFSFIALVRFFFFSSNIWFLYNKKLCVEWKINFDSYFDNIDHKRDSLETLKEWVLDENWEIESKEFFDFYSFILGIFSLLLYNKHTTTHNNTHYKIWDGSDKRSHHPRTKMINDVTIIMRKRNETILMKHFIMKKIHKLNVSLSLLHSTSVDDYNS